MDAKSVRVLHGLVVLANIAGVAVGSGRLGEVVAGVAKGVTAGEAVGLTIIEVAAEIAVGHHVWPVVRVVGANEEGHSLVPIGFFVAAVGV
jgi:hypothetical protein